MARITKQILGEVSGKIDNLVYRNMNGKTFVSLRPDRYRISKSKNEVTSKKNFSANVAFCKFVYSIPEIRKIWRDKRNGFKNPFSSMISINSKYIENGFLTKGNKITPKGNSLLINSIEFSGSQINVTFDELPFPEFTLVLITAFFDAENKNIQSIKFLHFSHLHSNLVKAIVIDMSELVNSISQNYNNAILYLTAIDEADELKCTSTFSCTIKKDDIP